MITIICSTNRPDAVSKKISEQYQGILGELNTPSRIIDLNDLPDDFVFSALYHKSGKNKAFNSFRNEMKEAQKMIFIVPEYNGSFPGVLKAFIDGLEYPGTFQNKKCALVGISSGDQGGGLALSHLTDIFNYCGMNVLAQKPRLSTIERYFDGERITHPLYITLLKEQAAALIRF